MLPTSNSRSRYSTIARLGIFTLAAIGLSGVAPIAYQQLSGVSACPALGPAPACYVVLVGYGFIAVSAFFRSRVQAILFLAGWGPLFLLALVGSSLELVVGEVCPGSSAGIPACFLSLALAAALAVIYLLERRQSS